MRFLQVSGISNEIFRQIQTIEKEYDASTAAALQAVEKRGEMIVRILDMKNLGKAGAEAAKKLFSLQVSTIRTSPSLIFNAAFDKINGIKILPAV